MQIGCSDDVEFVNFSDDNPTDDKDDGSPSERTETTDDEDEDGGGGGDEDEKDNDGAYDPFPVPALAFLRSHKLSCSAIDIHIRHAHMVLNAV
mgnify:CR=1 FL=1